MDMRKGPWTREEDSKLKDYITVHGEGDWNSVALCAGLKRNGKSCRFRWLNYLRPGVRHGNITLQEQLIILRLHSRLGNRWSKIAKQLPGRTDNDIKNYWRTRVQKQAKQLNCDINSNQFRDTIRYLWLPRLLEQIGTSSSSSSSSPVISTVQPISAGGGGDHSRCTAIATGQVLQTGLGPAPHDPVITPDLSGLFLDPFEAQTPIIDNVLNGRNWPINDFQDGLIYSPELVDGPSGHISQGLDIQSLDHSHCWLSGEYWSDIFFDDDRAGMPSPAQP